MKSMPLAAFLSVAAAPLAALADAAPAASPAPRSFAEVWQTGGWLMFVLAALSVLGLALVFYFLAVLRARAIVPADQALRLRDLLKSRRAADARELCASRPTALASVVAAGLDFLQDHPGGSPAMVKEIMESEGARQTSRMHNMIHYLLDLSSVAPMVGLLGTVIGLLKAFNTVAFDSAKAQPVELAAGVGQALVTTIAGLVVAIPAMMAYSWFRGRVAKLAGDLERASSDIYAVLESAPAEEPRP